MSGKKLGLYIGWEEEGKGREASGKCGEDPRATMVPQSPPQAGALTALLLPLGTSVAWLLTPPVLQKS